MSQSKSNLPTHAIVTENLRKVYTDNAKKVPDKVALKNLSLKIPRGRIFGLLGPNGAGKSTLINILSGLVTKTQGKAFIWGMDIDKHPRNIKGAIGIVPQELNIDPFFSPRQILDIQAGLFGVPKAQRKTDEILEAIGLTDKAEAYTRTLSGGMRRRLLVGKAMVHTPPILVLDEPTAGVDVALRTQLWAHIKKLNAQGVTILLTTHYLEEAENLCDEIAIINHGELVAHDTTQALLDRVDRKTLIFTLVSQDKNFNIQTLPQELQLLEPKISVNHKEQTLLSLTYIPSKISASKIINVLQESALSYNDISTKDADLESVFIHLTKTPPTDT